MGIETKVEASRLMQPHLCPKRAGKTASRNQRCACLLEVSDGLNPVQQLWFTLFTTSTNDSLPSFDPKSQDASEDWRVAVIDANFFIDDANEPASDGGPFPVLRRLLDKYGTKLTLTITKHQVKRFYGLHII